MVSTIKHTTTRSGLLSDRYQLGNDRFIYKTTDDFEIIYTYFVINDYNYYRCLGELILY